MSRGNRQRWSLRLARWHRWAGITAALFVLLLALTGLLLQHAPALGLDRAAVGSTLLARWLGHEAGPVTAFRAGGGWVLGNNGGLWHGRTRVATVAAPPDGALAVDHGLAVAVDGDLYLFDAEGRLLERVRAAGALPAPVRRLGRAEDGTAVVEADGRVWQAGENWLVFEPHEGDTISWSRPGTPPDALARFVRESGLAGAVTWERLLLELHSGRLGGNAGVIVMDLAAIVLLLLSVTGLYLWWRRR